MLSEGWMVNFAMRRVEPVVRESSPYNRLDYGKYRGPKRSYMLHNDQVHGTELEAMQRLYHVMNKRHNDMMVKLRRYGAELVSVAAAVVALESPPTVPEKHRAGYDMVWDQSCRECRYLNFGCGAHGKEK